MLFLENHSSYYIRLSMIYPRFLFLSAGSGRWLSPLEDSCNLFLCLEKAVIVTTSPYKTYLHVDQENRQFVRGCYCGNIRRLSDDKHQVLPAMGDITAMSIESAAIPASYIAEAVSNTRIECKGVRMTAQTGSRASVTS